MRSNQPKHRHRPARPGEIEGDEGARDEPPRLEAVRDGGVDDFPRSSIESGGDCCSLDSSNNIPSNTATREPRRLRPSSGVPGRDDGGDCSPLSVSSTVPPDAAVRQPRSPEVHGRNNESPPLPLIDSGDDFPPPVEALSSDPSSSSLSLLRNAGGSVPTRSGGVQRGGSGAVPC